MTLYHFTAPHLVKSILIQGITRGFIPDYVNGEVVLRPNLISLTTNGVFSAQDWCDNSTLGYDRAAYRLSIAIPKARREQVIDWLEFCQGGGISREMANVLNEFGSPHEWRLWRGVIPRAWIFNVTEKPMKLLVR